MTPPKRCCLPRWVIVLLTCAAIPWLAWITHATIKHEAYQEFTNHRLDRLEQK